jgi:hypothetical protein
VGSGLGPFVRGANAGRWRGLTRARRSAAFCGKLLAMAALLAALWSLSAGAAAGEIAVGLPSGGQRVGEVVGLYPDCSATLRIEDGAVFHMGTESIASAWLMDGIEDADGRLIVPPEGQGLVQVQGLTDSLTLRVNGRILQVTPGALVPLPPGRHLVRLHAPGCGRQIGLIQVEAGTITPLVFNRPVETFIVPKMIGVAVVVVTYWSLRLLTGC